MSHQKRYQKYSTQEYFNNYSAPYAQPRMSVPVQVPNGIIMPQGYGVADFTPRTIHVNNVPVQRVQVVSPQPVVYVRQPVVGLVRNPFTGMYEYKIIG